MASFEFLLLFGQSGQILLTKPFLPIGPLVNSQHLGLVETGLYQSIWLVNGRYLHIFSSILQLLHHILHLLVAWHDVSHYERSSCWYSMDLASFSPVINVLYSTSLFVAGNYSRTVYSNSLRFHFLVILDSAPLAFLFNEPLTLIV